MKRGKQNIVSFCSQWDEEKKNYDSLKMINDFLDYIGNNNLYINQIIRWTDSEIKALVEEKNEDFVYDLEGIENLIKENQQ
jgi:hypothetical protein